MASVTSSWWSKHEPKGWSGTGIGDRLRIYEKNHRKLLQTGAGQQPKDDEERRLGKESYDALGEVLSRLAAWKKKKPLTGTEAEEINAFQQEVKKARQQLHFYAK